MTFDLSSRWRRFALYILFNRRLIFSLLLLNLAFFVVMYFIISPNEPLVTINNTGKHPDLVLNVNPPVELQDDSVPEEPVKFPGAVIDHFQKNCSSLRRPPENITDDFCWHTVTSSTYVYSAYFDNRTSTDFILIWGISAGVDHEDGRIYPTKQYCQVWYRGKQLPVILWADYELIPETHGLRYAPAMFLCRVLDRDPPYAVSLVRSKCERPSHVLPVRASRPRDHARHKFTMCVSPLNKHYDDIYSFVENVELNRILGADKIVFYNHTTGDRLNKYLDHYVKSGLVDVIPWRIPVAVEPDQPDPRVSPQIHYFGQVIALNDCLYRYMYNSEYIVFTDLDEVILPRQHTSWSKMIIHLKSKDSRFDSANENDLALSSRIRAGAFLFRNVFFRIDWPDEGGQVDGDRKFRLRTQLKLKRENNVWPYYERSKYIVVPRTVLSIGIHYVFEFVQNGAGGHFVQKEVPMEVALLHHYREWGHEPVPPEAVVDRSAVRFGPVLRQAVMDTHRTVGLVEVRS